MAMISLRQVGCLTIRPLFSNLTFTLADTDRLGVVAPNGAGKTTFLRCLAGLQDPTRGEIVRSRGLRIAMVEQDVPPDLMGLTLTEAVRRAIPRAEREATGWRAEYVLDGLADDDAAAGAKLARDMREAARLRRSANELRNIGINSRSDAAQKKSAQMARRAERLEEELQPVPRERSGAIRLTNRDTHAHVLLELKDVAVAPPYGAELFHIRHLTIFRADRIVLLGRNGVGKSLFVQLLHRAMTDPDGVPGIRVSTSAVVGYVDQSMSHLPPDGSPFQFLSERFGIGDQRTRSLLAGAGFPVDRHRQPIGTFSPGQRARLGLLSLRLTEPNVYLLDEPTNHLDIPGQEALEAEIVERGATCILVSHDRRFVRSVGTRFLLIERGSLREVEAV
jgi:ATPase subunit of ABC transporter with duplicated ATPase domains